MKPAARAVSRVALSAFVAAASLICAASAAAQAGPSAGIEVSDAWIRWLPGNLPAAGYLTLVNRGDRPLILVAASSPNYAEVSLHRSLDRAGIGEMVPMRQITIGAHASLKFAAMGYHMMLMQPTKALQPGDQVPITLHFADGSAVTVKFAVRAPNGT